MVKVEIGRRGMLLGLVAAGVFALSVAEECRRLKVDFVPPMRVALTFDDSLKDHLLIAAPELEKRGWRGTFNIVTDWVGRGDKFLTWGDVRELIRRGHEVTTHTKTHRDLVNLLKDGRDDEVRRELSLSRDEIADKTGFTPRFMCAPFVSQNDATDRFCRETGLRQMSACRHNFGEGNEDQVAEIVRRRRKEGSSRLDILHHGISAADHGGWRPFRDRESFARHLDVIAALERSGEIIVTDYDGMVSDCALKSRNWPRHGVIALSFDDRNMVGWKKSLSLLKRFGASATFFVCGSFEGQVGL